MGQLGVRIIFAVSAEADGYPEPEENVTDRLVKELHIAGIHTIGDANIWLPSFIKDHNTRFARKPREVQSAFRPNVRSAELEVFLCHQEPIKLDRGLAFRYHNKTFVLPERHNGKSLIARASQPVTGLDSQRFGIRAQLTVGNERAIVVPKETMRQPRVVEPGRKQTITPEQRRAYRRIGGASNSPWSTFRKGHGPRQAG